MWQWEYEPITVSLRYEQDACHAPASQFPLASSLPVPVPTNGTATDN
jgi:hypothetical protein